MARKRDAPHEEDHSGEGGALMDAIQDSPRKGMKPTAESSARGSNTVPGGDDDEGMGEFEDQWDDQVEDEDEGEVVIAPDSDEEDDMELDTAQQEEEEEQEEEFKVYLPGQELDEGEELVADNSTYEMLHSMGVEYPFLTFDILRDNLGVGRSTFPMTVYVVAGSQAPKAKDNKLYIMKMSQLHRTRNDDDDDMADDDDDDDLDEDPILESRTIPHMGGVNRLRMMPHPESHIAATWSDTGKVHIWDLSEHVRALDTPGLVPPRNPSPLYTVQNHGKTEGYGLAWSAVRAGRLLSGDTAGRIFLTQRTATSFETDAQSFQGHTDSVEDIQWSPKQGEVFATSSVDQTIKIWDARTKDKYQLSVHAHDSDVNVISWHPTVDYLLASGADCGTFSIWDLRMWASTSSTNPPAPAATFKWHQGPITSLEWKPHESSVIAVSGEDNQLTLWDFALERDAEEEATMKMGANGQAITVPAQLLFIHQGQNQIKDLHWHPQIPGVVLSTALDGCNIFKTINS
ncbi:WD40-repeat-containing domain protein [Phlyctochytrium arcticum]|nr:WD40-repeat-containing domain protein [Phlyctochytrium arcticum]